MNADAKRTLIAKIEALSDEERKEVDAFVSQLLDASDQDGSEPRYLDQTWAGALRDLKDEYTTLELEDEIMKQWLSTARD